MAALIRRPVPYVEAADTDVVPGTQITANSNSDQAVRLSLTSRTLPLGMTYQVVTVGCLSSL